MKFEFEIDQRDWIKSSHGPEQDCSSRYWTIGEARFVVPMTTDALQSCS